MKPNFPLTVLPELNFPNKLPPSSFLQLYLDFLAINNNVKIGAMRPAPWSHLGLVFCGKLREVYPPLDMVT